MLRSRDFLRPVINFSLLTLALFATHPAHSADAPSSGSCLNVLRDFPLAKIEKLKPLISDNPAFEKQYSIKRKLFPDGVGHLSRDLSFLKAYADQEFDLQASWISQEIFNPDRRSKGLMVLQGGGPGLSFSYMKKRYEAELRSGFDILVVYPRGSIDNRWKTIADGGFQFNVNIPLNFSEAEKANPVVISEVASMGQSAGDVIAMVEHVLKSDNYKNNPQANPDVFIGGQSAGGKSVQLIMAKLGAMKSGTEPFIPKGVMLSAASLPLTMQLLRWADGAVQQHEIWNRLYKTNKEFMTAHREIFRRLRVAPVTPQRRDDLTRILHTFVGFDVDPREGKVQELTETLTNMIKTFDEDPSGNAFEKFMLNEDHYIDNLLYEPLMAMTNDGMTDMLSSMIVEAILKELGITVGATEFNQVNFLSGYTEIHKLEAKRDYDRRADIASRQGRFRLDDEKFSDLLSAFRKVTARGGHIVMVNGDYDWVSNPKVQFGGAQYEAEGQLDYLNPKASGISLYLVHPPFGHPDNFNYTVNAETGEFTPSEQFKLVNQILNGELTDAQIKAHPFVLTDEKQMEDHINFYVRLKSAAQKTFERYAPSYPGIKRLLDLYFPSQK